jgi:hypothetical protein
MSVHTIGLIYSNGCIHCQNLKPIWEQMVNEFNELKYQYSPYNVMETETTNLTELDKFNNENAQHLKNGKISIQMGVPTLYKIKNGNIEYFNENRDLDTMKKWFEPPKTNSIGEPRSSFKPYFQTRYTRFHLKKRTKKNKKNKTKKHSKLRKYKNSYTKK